MLQSALAAPFRISQVWAGSSRGAGDRRTWATVPETGCRSKVTATHRTGGPHRHPNKAKGSCWSGLIGVGVAVVWPLAAHPQEVVSIAGPDQRIDPEFQEVYRVGSAHGEPWELFTRVRRMGFDADGNLFVFDGAGGMDPKSRVLVFDAEGRFLREFGTVGEGPGEFRLPVDLAVLRTGTTVVSDFGHRAYHIFDRSGQLVRTVATATLLGTAILDGTIYGDPRGDAVFVVPRSAGPRMLGDQGSPPTSRPIAKIELGGDRFQPDTVIRAWMPPRTPRGGEVPNTAVSVGDRTINVREAVGSMTSRAVFEPELLVGILPNGGIVYSDSSAYAVKITDPTTGQVARMVTRPIRPEPVTEAMKRDYLERMEKQTGVKGGGKLMDLRFSSQSSGDGSPQQAGVTFSLEPAPFYPELPVLEALSTTWEGRIWVLRRGKDDESGGPIDIFGSDGEYVGTYPAGATDVPGAFGPGGLAAFVELDELDVATVVVRRLSPKVR